ncbi:MAG: hypothetical protein E6713_16555 [Sporomusaceae bacterium]|nr:hypothetical protein [Sporomusaceae bacterium]
MKMLDRKTCGLLKAATIEAEMHRKVTKIAGFTHRDRRVYGQAEVKTVRMDPAELDLYLKEQAKGWGRQLAPSRSRQ